MSTTHIPVTLAALSHTVVNSITFGQIIAATSHAVPQVAAHVIAGIPHAVSVVSSKGVAKVVVTVAKEVSGRAIAPYIGSAISKGLIANHFAYQLGVSIQQHSSALITKIAAKVAAKITKKAAAKAVAGFVPFAGALAAAGINAWILQSFAESADVYYSLKASAAQD